MLFAVVGLFSLATAQIKTPAPSPFSKIEQTAGLTTITIEYSRPSVKDRTIFGNVVPWGQTWRTGANMNTKVTFSENVKIAGKDLKAGTYALYTVPNPTSWDIIFYTDSNNGGVPQSWDASKEALRFKATPQATSFQIESFLIDVNNLRNESCSIGMGWDKTWVQFDVMLNTDEVVTKNIDRIMAGPDANDLYNAGRYYYEAGKDMNKAYDWIHRSNEKDPTFWKLRQEALVLAKLGKYSDAISVAEKSTAMAKKADNSDYQRMNDESINEWKGMMKKK